MGKFSGYGILAQRWQHWHLLCRTPYVHRPVKDRSAIHICVGNDRRHVQQRRGGERASPQLVEDQEALQYSDIIIIASKTLLKIGGAASV